MGQKIKVNFIKLERKLKYPSGNRLEIIKSNEDESIAVTLNVIDSPLDEERVWELTMKMQMNMLKQ
ncbi:hypothetical protein [Clostridium saccharoperbutylacetonicum]|uniref:hypothetical protein n=1 Tax=Clostridium saccharoperbutylacetonicum TaxID=36745 RepID=UPI0009840474|nr:hypothetical protein [Clostridium saccharoperbutylacetonicum]AQR94682.1 hypothetical protein CLSAP_19960 [Clostridium saccharoperbutylacetonicum]NSB30523.1 hypothetical protein [Clostridium saccharoperbutylacetonicum]